MEESKDDILRIVNGLAHMQMQGHAWQILQDALRRDYWKQTKDCVIGGPSGSEDGRMYKKSVQAALDRLKDV